MKHQEVETYNSDQNYPQVLRDACEEAIELLDRVCDRNNPTLNHIQTILEKALNKGETK
jgi:hypothetical protein